MASPTTWAGMPLEIGHGMMRNRLTRLSLTQLLLIAVFIALLPTALLSIYLSVTGRDQARELISERLTASAAATAAIQRESFASIDTLLVDLTASPSVRNFDKDCGATLQRAIHSPSAASNFARIDADGTIRCSALPLPPDASTNVATQPWWQQGKATGKIAFSDPQFGEISRHPVIVVMRPMRDAFGGFGGAMTAGVDIGWIGRALSLDDHNGETVVALVDRDGAIITANQQSPLSATALLIRAREPTAVTDAEGNEWLYASSPVWGDSLYILYAEPLQPLVGPISTQMRLNIALPIATIILTCIAIWLVMMLFAERWLQRLRALIAQFAQGNYAVDPAAFAAAPADIAMLADDMKRMARSISDRDAALRASAQQRLELVGEVNHRVKNNLQMILSLVSLQAGSTRDEQSRATMDQMRLRIGTLALIYRSLYAEEGEGEQGRVDVDRLMHILAQQVLEGPHEPMARIDVASRIGVRSVDEAIPLAMFTVEALSSMIAPDGSKGDGLTLDISAADGATTVMIEAQQAAPVMDAQGKGLPAMLMNAYARQLGGAIDVSHPAACGTRLSLRYRWREPVGTAAAEDRIVVPATGI
jgi:two-component sensor histidine kinase